MRWSTVLKARDMVINDLVTTLCKTARGVNTRVIPDEPAAGHLDELTSRRQTFMGMDAAALRSTAIARRLNASHESIRKEMSDAYRVLVLDATPEEDLRTLAIPRVSQIERRGTAEPLTPGPGVHRRELFASGVIALLTVIRCAPR